MLIKDEAKRISWEELFSHEIIAPIFIQKDIDTMPNTLLVLDNNTNNEKNNQ